MLAETLIECGCGCGETLADRDSRGRRRRYVHAHNRRGKSNTWKIKPIVLPRTSHERAVKIKRGVDRCEFERIGYCKGPLEVAHVNQDEMDNDPANLLQLCMSHHKLMDHGKIDPKAPSMPRFRTDPRGKRRY